MLYTRGLLRDCHRRRFLHFSVVLVVVLVLQESSCLVLPCIKADKIVVQLHNQILEVQNQCVHDVSSNEHVIAARFDHLKLMRNHCVQLDQFEKELRSLPFRYFLLICA